MNITRRSFMKWALGSAALLGLSPMDLLKMQEALAAVTSPPVLWLQGASCTGCSVAAMNVVSPATIDQILLNTVSAKWHPTLMCTGGTTAMEVLDAEAVANSGSFILVVEGGIPTTDNGSYCVIGTNKKGVPITMLSALKLYGPKAKYIVAAGTCASFSGVAGSGANPTGVASVRTVLGTKSRVPIINIPGCPAPPEVLFGTIVKLLGGTLPPLDVYARPSEFYGTFNHDNCLLQTSSHSLTLGSGAGCLEYLGCRGTVTNGSCPNHQWNNRSNYCMQAGHHCIGCSAPDFPTTPLYKFGTYV